MDHPHAVVGDESALVFAGFAAFLDPPKESAKRPWPTSPRAGSTVKIVTGDNELVTQHVCDELGLPVLGVLTGRRSSRWTTRPCWPRWSR